MDEKLIEEISSTTGVPQMLVSRSAQARAEANGTDVSVFNPEKVIATLYPLLMAP